MIFPWNIKCMWAILLLSNGYRPTSSNVKNWKSHKSSKYWRFFQLRSFLNYEKNVSNIQHHKHDTLMFSSFSPNNWQLKNGNICSLLVEHFQTNEIIISFFNSHCAYIVYKLYCKSGFSRWWLSTRIRDLPLQSF